MAILCTRLLAELMIRFIFARVRIKAKSRKIRVRIQESFENYGSESKRSLENYVVFLILDLI